MDIALSVLMTYVLGGLIWPQVVRQRQFFLIGSVVVIAAMLLSGLPILGRLFEAGAFVLLFLAAGGARVDQYWRELRG